MKVAMFQTPFVRPERSADQVMDWALRQAVVADEAGFSDYWIGEHATMNWESIPSPELVIAAAGRVTKNLRFGPGAHLAPYHHPATLAIQSAWQSQVLKGRYILGIGAGAYPTDAALRGITDMSHNGRMTVEAIEIMQKIWKAEPFHFEGEYWHAGYPEAEPGHPMRDTRPYGGEMPMAMTALSANSPTIKLAAKVGALPLSIWAGDAYVKAHWKDYEQYSAEAGRTVDRSMHSVVRDVVIADTDAEAQKLALEGGLGRAWEEYLLPTYKRFGVLDGMIHDPDNVSASDVDAKYLAEHVWLVGSPETVQRKFEDWFERLDGGYGTHIMYSHDYIDAPEGWEESMRRFATEVAPKIDITAKTAA